MLEHCFIGWDHGGSLSWVHSFTFAQILSIMNFAAAPIINSVKQSGAGGVG